MNILEPLETLQSLKNENFLDIAALKYWVSEYKEFYEMCLPYSDFYCDECRERKNEEGYVPHCVFDSDHPCERNKRYDKVFFVNLYEESQLMIELQEKEELCRLALETYDSITNDFVKLNRWFIEMSSFMFELRGLGLDEEIFTKDSSGKISGLCLVCCDDSKEKEIIMHPKDFKNIISIFELNRKLNPYIKLLVITDDIYN